VQGALFPGIKQPGREADHSLPVIAEGKKEWRYTSSPPNTFIAYTHINLLLLHKRTKEEKRNGKNAFSQSS
jgi:hypothetical protein